MTARAILDAVAPVPMTSEVFVPAYRSHAAIIVATPLADFLDTVRTATGIGKGSPVLGHVTQLPSVPQ